jgi:hypothetical protein
MASELQPFVREALTKGISRQQIKEKLLAANWSEDEITNALSLYAEVDFPIPVPRRKPYLSAREAFFYLVLFITLYISAISFGTLLFQFVNRWMPDPLQTRYYYDVGIGIVRNATASLVIAYPAFLFVNTLLAKAVARDPEKRSSKVKKWLTYITLVIAVGVIIGDLIALVNNVLAGELTLRFFLKVMIVFGIAGLIFGYYLWDLRSEEKEQ